nr:ROK family protein [Pyrinomonadaceae bacterium]
MPTIRDIAELAGVSTATVSHVINNTRVITPETRARVERVIAEAKFVPNPMGRLLAQQRSGAHVSTPSSVSTTFSFKHSSSVAHKASNKPGDTKTAANPYSPSVSSVSSDTVLNKPFETSSTSEVGSPTTTRTLLKMIRAAQPVSRAELARRLGVNRSTVTEIVRPLLEAGALREGVPDTAESRIGRPPVGLSLASEQAYFIGVNIGVRQSQVGLAQTDSRVLGEECFDTPTEPTEALALIRSSIIQLRTRLPRRVPVFIGVSVPGPVDAERARLLYAPHLGWRDTDVAGALSQTAVDGSVQSGMKTLDSSDPAVVVENDATAAAVYEARRRLRESTDSGWNDFVLVRAGTGIGVGLVRGGEVYRGTGAGGGLAGEFGHMTIVAGGKPCACGNRGCWERYASATSAAALYTGDRQTIGSFSSVPSFVEVVARAEAGERRAQATLEGVGEYLGIGIANVISGL